MTYEYHHPECNASATLRFVPVEHPVPKCPVCGEPMTLVIHAPGLVFKGCGFHCNDYPARGGGRDL